MTPHSIIFKSAFWLTLLCGWAALAVLFILIGEVNRKLPDDGQMGYVFLSWLQFMRLFREYRRLYPKSRLATVWVSLVVATLVAALALLAAISIEKAA
jgi:ABC-type spermidine/putrescine transport system permease subunit I